MWKILLFFIFFGCNRSEKRPLVIQAKDNRGNLLNGVQVFVEKKFVGETNKTGDFIIDVHVEHGKTIKVEMTKDDPNGYFAPYYYTISPKEPLEEKFFISAILYSVPKSQAQTELKVEKEQKTELKVEKEQKTETTAEQKIEVVEKEQEQKVEKKIEQTAEIKADQKIEKFSELEYPFKEKKKQEKQEMQKIKEKQTNPTKEELTIDQKQAQTNQEIDVKEYKKPMKVNALRYSYHWTRALPALVIYCDGKKIGLTDRLGRFSGFVSEKTKTCIFESYGIQSKQIEAPFPENIQLTFYQQKDPYSPKLGVRFFNIPEEKQKIITSLIFSSNKNFSPFEKTSLPQESLIKTSAWQSTHINPHLDLLLDVTLDEDFMSWSLVDNKNRHIFFQHSDIGSNGFDLETKKNYQNMIQSFPFETQVYSVSSETEGSFIRPKGFPLQVGDVLRIQGYIKDRDQSYFGETGYVKILSLNEKEAFFHFFKNQKDQILQIGDLLEKPIKSSGDPNFFQVEKLKKEQDYDGLVQIYEKVLPGDSHYLKTRYNLGDLYLRHKNMPEKSAHIFAELSKRYKTPPISLIVYEGISVFFTGEKIYKKDISMARKHYEKSIEILTKAQDHLKRQTDETAASFENIYFHRALSYQRLWEIEKKLIFLQKAYPDWESFLKKPIHLIKYEEEAKKYAQLARNQLSLSHRASSEP